MSLLILQSGTQAASPDFLGTVIAGSVTPTSDTPGAEAESYGVLDNDTPTNGNSLVAVLVTDVPPEDGTINFFSNGSFVFTPDPAFSGTTSFTYKARDSVTNEESSAATVTITITEGFSDTASTGSTTIMGETPTGDFGSGVGTPVDPPPDPVTIPGGGGDLGQRLTVGFDPVLNALRFTDVGAASGDTGTHLDAAQILERCWDSDKKAIRVVFV